MIKGSPPEDVTHHHQTFQVETLLELRISPLSPEEARQGLEDSTNEVEPTRLINNLQALEADARVYLSEITTQLPQAAPYFSALETRLQLMTQLLAELFQEDESLSPPQWVNLSETGLDFCQEVPVEAGQLLKLVVILSNTQRRVDAFAEVVYCTSLPGSTPPIYQMGVEFKAISYGDKRALSRYILYCQTHARRALQA